MRPLMIVLTLALTPPVTLWTRPAAAQDAAAGAALYLQHCATCHGAAATGGGPMAPVLLVQPKDLTRLAAENVGIFPLERVVARIDGSDPLVSHGSAMPIYGEAFAGDDTMIKTPAGQPLMTSRSIADLAVFLAGIQQ